MTPRSLIKAALALLAALPLASCGGSSATTLEFHFVLGLDVFHGARTFTIDVWASAGQGTLGDLAKTTNGMVTASASGGTEHISVTFDPSTSDTQFDESAPVPGISGLTGVNFIAKAFDGSGHEIAKATEFATTLEPGQANRVELDYGSCEVMSCKPYHDAGPPDAGIPDSSTTDGSHAERAPADAASRS